MKAALQKSQLMLFRKKKQRRDKAAIDRLACLILKHREDRLCEGFEVSFTHSAFVSYDGTLCEPPPSSLNQANRHTEIK